MIVREKKDNCCKEYKLIYDRKSIETIVKMIMKDCGVRVRGKYKVEGGNSIKQEIENLVTLTGDYLYENVSDITKLPIDDPYGYWRHGDPVPFSFTADKMIYPDLVDYLLTLLEKKDDYDFGKYYFDIVNRT